MTAQTEPTRGGPSRGIGRVLATTDRLVVRVAWGMRILSGLVIVAMMLTTGYDVLMRYAFAAPTEWALTLNAAAVLAATFLALPHLAAVHGHIDMDLVYRRLSRRGQQLADVITGVAAVSFGAAMAWLGYRAALTAYIGGIVTSGNFNIPLWSVYGLIYVGGLGLLVVVLLSPWRKSADADRPGGDALDTREGVS
jgi:TRAP-type C4-dicarboxylate transport system permease small subunit